jgi:hypothetical protein
VKLTTHLHLVPRSKHAWSYTSTPQYSFVAWCSVKKHRDTFTFYLSMCTPINVTRTRLYISVRAVFSNLGDRQRCCGNTTHVRNSNHTRGRKMMKKEKTNKSCEYWGEGMMTCHEASAYFTVSVLIVRYRAVLLFARLRSIVVTAMRLA